MVELIIVIAILAILIGVITLAVLPNIQRSRESKDLTKLDNIATSVNVAIANHKITSDGGFEINGTEPSDEVDKTVYDAIKLDLGDLTGIQMESAGAKGNGNIKVKWEMEDDIARITVQIGDGNVPCIYTKGEPGNSDGYRYYRVDNF